MARPAKRPSGFVDVPDRSLAAERLGGYLSGAIALLACAVLFPTLASSPQSGDGAEQVMVATRGGILHPPGFPVQAWINRLFALIPAGTVAYRLSLVSWLAQLGAVFFLAETLRLLGCSLICRGIASGSFAFFPAIWYLAVQPEVLSGATFFVAAVLFHSVRTIQRPPSGQSTLGAAMGLGLVSGLAASQHLTTAVTAPAILTCCYALLSLRKGGAPAPSRLLLAVVGVFVAVLAVLYGSLPWLKGDALWPSWGELGTPGAIVAHMFRVEYGVFTLAADSDAGSLRAIHVFLGDLLHCWNVVCPFLLVGAVSLKGMSRGGLLSSAITGTLAVAALFLYRAKAAPIDAALGSSILERFEGPAAIPAAILLGVGLNAGYQWAVAKLGRRAKALGWGFGCLWIAFLVASGWERGDASRDNTAEVFMTAVGMELPRESIYFSRSDLESFHGAPTADGLRFPIERGLLGNRWYFKNVASKLQPRVASIEPDSDVKTMVERLYLQALSIVSTDILQLWFNDHAPETLGVLMRLSHPLQGQFTKNTANAALRLCPLIREKLCLLPREGHAASRQLWKYFARAYFGAGQYFESVGLKEAAALAREIQKGLLEGKNPERWVTGCAKLSRLFPDGVK